MRNRVNNLSSVGTVFVILVLGVVSLLVTSYILMLLLGGFANETGFNTAISFWGTLIGTVILSVIGTFFKAVK